MPSGFTTGGFVCTIAALVGCGLGREPAPHSESPQASAEGSQAASPNSDQRPDLRPKVEVPGAVFTLEFDDSDPPIEIDRLSAWMQSAGTWVADYYGGQFPVPDLEVTIVPSRRSGIGFGQHWDGRWLKIWVGKRTSDEELRDDWVLVHEMLHACFPDLDDDHRWMQEGLSTYLEPIVRERAGNMTEAELWAKWVRNMPQGRPRAGDRGLARTHTWGRTYWGGALFWLVIDIELRRQSQGKATLRQALQAIVAQGGTGRADWPVQRVLDIGDKASGTTVFSDTYDRLARAPGDVDLDSLWHDLGVVSTGPRTVSFNDAAPLAPIRKAATNDP